MNVGSAIVDFAASDDIFGTLLAARHDVKNTADVDKQTQMSLLDRRLENVEEIRENLLQMIGQMSGQAENLSAYKQHTEDMQIQIQTLTGELEDADAVSAIVELQAHEHQFNLELALAARISNMSLLNHLR
jgi:flagellin-like hook-associated protein FlgL